MEAEALIHELAVASAQLKILVAVSRDSDSNSLADILDEIAGTLDDTVDYLAEMEDYDEDGI